MLLLESVISGGQTGADIGALRAARFVGFRTGGFVPKGCRTLRGPNRELVEIYGCVETDSWQYPVRTELNVRDSDATIRIATDFFSSGEKCTARFIRIHQKPFLDINPDTGTSVIELEYFLDRHYVRTLNVAGNSEQTSPGIEEFVEGFLTEAFSYILEKVKKNPQE